jgi:hypothetical protein
LVLAALVEQPERQQVGKAVCLILARLRMQTVVGGAQPDRLRLVPGGAEVGDMVILLRLVLRGQLVVLDMVEVDREAQQQRLLDFLIHLWVEQAAEQPLRGWQMQVERRR